MLDDTLKAQLRSHFEKLTRPVTLAASLDDGRIVTAPLFQRLLEEECAPFSGGRFEEAKALFASMTLAEDFPEFLTLGAYELLD